MMYASLILLVSELFSHPETTVHLPFICVLNQSYMFFIDKSLNKVRLGAGGCLSKAVNKDYEQPPRTLYVSGFSSSFMASELFE